MLPLRRSMYTVLLALGVCLRLCAARAVANDVSTAQMHTSAPASGTLFQLAANALLDQRNAAVSPNRTLVSLPLGPIDQVGIDQPHYSHGPFPMKGGALIFVLHSQAYGIWGQMTTEEIHRPQKSTFAPPFNFIGVELKPTAVAPTVVTSVKMGIAVLHLMDDLFRTRFWPSAIEVRVNEVTYGPPLDRQRTSRPLGDIFVRHSFFWKPKNGIIPPGPLGMDLGKALSVQSGSNSTGLDSGTLGASISDWTWLHCASKLMWFSFVHDASRPVTDVIIPPRQVSFRDIPGMEYSLIFTKNVSQIFRWVDLATGMLYMLRDRAMRDRWEPLEDERIMKDGIVMVEVRIVPVPSVEEETAAATA